MVRMYKYSNNYILDNTTYDIDLNLLGKTINRWLKDVGEISINNDMTRCQEVGGYIIVCPYGSLNGNDLYEFIRSFLLAVETPFQFEGNLPESLASTLPMDLPELRNYKDEQYGGGVNDTDELDQGVEPLCDALNSFPFVETFSSCHGHIKQGSGTLYVLFKIVGENRFESLDNLTTLLDQTFHTVWDEFSLNSEKIFPQFLFGKGNWNDVKGIYFEIRLYYRTESKDIVFLAIQKLSKLLKEKSI